MKRIIVGLITVCIIFISCKKDHSKDGNPDTAIHKIAYKVGFSQQIANFQINNSKPLVTSATNTPAIVAVPLSDNVDVIYYAVYDSQGNNVHIIKQTSSQAGFGAYTDNLHTGTYTLVIAAGKNGLLLGPDSLATTGSKLSKDVISYGGYITRIGDVIYNLFNKDAFYKKITLTVSKTDASEVINLDRITSKLTVNINDAIPVGANYYLVENLSSYPAVKFYVGNGTTPPYSSFALNSGYIVDTLKNTDIGTTNFRINTILLYTSPITVNLSCTHLNADNIIDQKIIQNVICERNAQTILSGNLFGGAGTHSTGGFTATIDTSWNSTPITKTFP